MGYEAKRSARKRCALIVAVSMTHITTTTIISIKSDLGVANVTLNSASELTLAFAAGATACEVGSAALKSP